MSATTKTYPVSLVAQSGREQPVNLVPTEDGIKFVNQDNKVMNFFTFQTIKKWIPSNKRSKNPGGPECLDLQIKSSKGARDLRIRFQDEGSVNSVIQDLTQNVESLLMKRKSEAALSQTGAGVEGTPNSKIQDTFYRGSVENATPTKDFPSQSPGTASTSVLRAVPEISQEADVPVLPVKVEELKTTKADAPVSPADVEELKAKIKFLEGQLLSLAEEFATAQNNAESAAEMEVYMKQVEEAVRHKEAEIAAAGAEQERLLALKDQEMVELAAEHERGLALKEQEMEELVAEHECRLAQKDAEMEELASKHELTLAHKEQEMEVLVAEHERGLALKEQALEAMVTQHEGALAQKEQEMEEMISEHQRLLKEVREERDAKVQELTQELGSVMEELSSERDRAVAEVTAQRDQALAAATAELDRVVEEFGQKRSSLFDQLTLERDQVVEQLNREIQALRVKMDEERDAHKAELEGKLKDLASEQQSRSLAHADFDSSKQMLTSEKLSLEAELAEAKRDKERYMAEVMRDREMYNVEREGLMREAETVREVNSALLKQQGELQSELRKRIADIDCSSAESKKMLQDSIQYLSAAHESSMRVQEIEARYLRLQASLEEADAAVTELRSKLLTNESLLQKKQTELQEALTQNATLEANLSEAKEYCTVALDAQEATKAEVVQLKAECDGLESELASSKSEVTLLRETLAGVESKLTKFQNKDEEVYSWVKESMASEGKAKQALVDAEFRCSHLEVQVADLREQLRSANMASMTALQESAASAAVASAESQSEIAALREQGAQLEEKVSELTSELETTKADLMEALDSKARVSLMSLTAMEQIQERDLQLEEVAKNVTAITNLMEGSTEEWQKEKQKYEDTIKTMLEECSKYASEFESSKQRLHDAHARVEILTRELQMSKTAQALQENDLRHELAMMAASYNNMAENERQLDAKEAMLRRWKEEAQQIASQLEQALSRHKQELEDRDVDLHALRQQVRTLQRENAILSGVSPKAGSREMMSTPSPQKHWGQTSPLTSRHSPHQQHWGETSPLTKLHSPSLAAPAPVRTPQVPANKRLQYMTPRRAYTAGGTDPGSKAATPNSCAAQCN